MIAQLRESAKKDGRGASLRGQQQGPTLPDKGVLSPDASCIPMERLKALSRNQRQKFPPLVPAFVVEIRSPSDRVEKILQEKCRRICATR